MSIVTQTLFVLFFMLIKNRYTLSQYFRLWTYNICWDIRKCSSWVLNQNKIKAKISTMSQTVNIEVNIIQNLYYITDENFIYRVSCSARYSIRYFGWCSQESNYFEVELLLLLLQSQADLSFPTQFYTFKLHNEHHCELINIHLPHKFT